MWSLIFDIWEKAGPLGLVIIILGAGVWLSRKDIFNLIAKHDKAHAQWLATSLSEQKANRDVIVKNTETTAKLHILIDERIPKK